MFLLSSLESPFEEISLILYKAKISSREAVENPATIPDLRESMISGSSRPVAKMEMKEAMVPTMDPATTEIESASLVVISVTSSVSSYSSRVSHSGCKNFGKSYKSSRKRKTTIDALFRLARYALYF